MTDTSAMSQPVDDGGWDFLEGSYWYVPPIYLPAVVVAGGNVVTVADQTVWHISAVVDGYLVGEARTNLGGGWQYSTFVGSITPQGDVTISFTLDGGGSVTVGKGHMRLVDGEWQFEMQMDTGDSGVSVSHWAYMAQARPGDAAWSALPGYPDSSIDALFDGDTGNDGGHDPTRTVVGTTGADLLIGAPILDVLLGQAGDDQIAGNGGDDLLFGGGGADSLNGGAGADLLDGGAGADLLDGSDGDDTLEGAGGADTLIGGAGIDTASFAGADAPVVASLSGAPAGGYLLLGVENLIGSGFADVLAGDGGANEIDGGRGDDTLSGAGGDDRLRGGLGRDTATFAGAAAGVAVDLSLHGVQDTGEGLDRLAGIENLTGSAFDDVLTGDDGKNVLTGGGGRDLLTGGGEADTFRFVSILDSAAAPDAADLILDLDDSDRIDLRAIDANTAKAGDQRFVLVAVLDGHAREAAVSYDAGHDRTLVQLDVDGDGSADMTIAVAGDHTAFGNFVL